MKYLINYSTENNYKFVVFHNLFGDNFRMHVYSKKESELIGIEVIEVEKYIEWKREEESD